jgi:hypothetical protein
MEAAIAPASGQDRDPTDAAMRRVPHRSQQIRAKDLVMVTRYDGGMAPFNPGQISN